MEQHNSRVITEANRSKQMWNWWRAKLDLATQSPWYASYILRRFYDFMKILRPSKQLVASTVTGAALLASSIALNPAPAHAASITVNSTADAALVASLNGNGTCDLREAFLAADTNVAVNECPAGTADATDTITLNTSGTITLLADLPSISDANEDIVLNGPGATSLTITGNTFRTIYSDGAGNDVTLSGITVTGSNTNGVHANNNVIVTNSVITANGSSGVVATNGDVTVTNSTISANATEGVYAQTNATVTNSTISGNLFRGVVANNNVTAVNSTIFGNTNYGIQKNAAGVLTLKNSLVVGNSPASASGDVSCIGANPVVTNGKNLINKSAGCLALAGEVAAVPAASIINTTLANNGGSTKTHALVAGSPAIDKGNNADSPGATDQRGTGFARIANATIDIGAFEFQVSNAVGGVAELITPHTASPVTTMGIMATLSALFMGAGAWLMRRR